MSKSNMSREDYKKARELEELRKTGAVAPEVDAEGKMINPHIPQYVANAPWYTSDGQPGLKHQYKKHHGTEAKKESIYAQSKRGLVAHNRTKWKKGACENCGATTHKKKDCLERPRRKGAKLTNSNLAKDEVIIEQQKISFEAKRDQWAGYDAATYQKNVEKFERVEKIRLAMKQKEIEEKMEAKAKASTERQLRRAERRAAKAKARAEGGDDGKITFSDSSESDHSSSDEEQTDNSKAVEKSNGMGNSRNLRIREDRAKYLRNLDLDSALYDAKSRSMRENPNPGNDPSDVGFAGDNFVRWKGDAAKVLELEKFVSDAQAKGNQDIGDIVANPSQAEYMLKAYKKKSASQKESSRESILGKYGGEEFFHSVPDPSLLRGESETYQEFDEFGKVIKGPELLIPKSKYMEDVLEGNHTEIWGSFYHDGKWGYACCKQTLRHAYCVVKSNNKRKLMITDEEAATKRQHI